MTISITMRGGLLHRNDRIVQFPDSLSYPPFDLLSNFPVLPLNHSIVCLLQLVERLPCCYAIVGGVDGVAFGFLRSNLELIRRSCVQLLNLLNFFVRDTLAAEVASVLANNARRPAGHPR